MKRIRYRKSTRHDNYIITDHLIIGKELVQVAIELKSYNYTLIKLSGEIVLNGTGNSKADAMRKVKKELLSMGLVLDTEIRNRVGLNIEGDL